MSLPSSHPLAGVTAAILAGGPGTRLRAVLGDRPKALAPVGGRPFLAYPLEQLAAAGVRTAVICTGWRGEAVQAAFGPALGPLRLEYSREAAPLGTAGALRAALPLLASPEVLVLSGDAFCEVDLAELARTHVRHGADATLVVVPVPEALPHRRVDVDPLGRVRAVRETAEPGPGWVSAGVYCLARRLLQALPAGPVSLEREALPGWLSRRCFALPTFGRFLDLDTPEAYAAAQAFFGPAAPSPAAGRERGPA
ncbi:MAG: sugar phosphate nucleotidyltransferase [Candidatus Methylomirabilales bacterium]